jgi:AraC-like DNA-binding protein
MRSSDRTARSIDTPTQHAEHVYLVAQGDTPAPGIEELSTSWQRCANSYRVNPVTSEAPSILTPHELKEHRQALEDLIFVSREEIDRLYKLVRAVGYTVLFCDTKGVAVEHRGEDAQSSQFEYWGTWLGGIWSEEVEGTNGIGTCIAEQRPVTVHRSQHFRSRHINLSCSGAPVFDVDGRLMAVLDVSAIDPTLSERAHALIGALTVTAARAIEERYFRQRFRRAWIIAIAPPEAGAEGMLLAVDGNQHILGANRAARASLSLDDDRLRAGASLWAIFQRDLSLFRYKDRTDIPTRLVVAGSNETWPGLATPPESSSSIWRNDTSAAWHVRPRLDLLDSQRMSVPASHARGGLPPGAMRRVSEYVESHLSETIDLAKLAATAGLSVYHFARAFKQSEGVTPHSYLIQRRVQRAQEMLAQTDLSLSEIALAAGFSDQSHLARHFRLMLGMTPGELRWSRR